MVQPACVATYIYIEYVFNTCTRMFVHMYIATHKTIPNTISIQHVTIEHKATVALSGFSSQ